MASQQVSVEAVLKYHDKQYAVGGSFQDQSKSDPAPEEAISYPKIDESARVNPNNNKGDPVSNSDIPFKLPVTRWYDSQKFCKRIGTTCGVVGTYLMGCGAYMLNRELFPRTGIWRSNAMITYVSPLLFKPRYPRVLLLVGSAGVITGIFLHRKKYYKDPEAITQYRKVFFSGRFIDGLQSFGWDELFLISTKEELAHYLHTESRNILGFYHYLQTYSQEHVGEFLHHGLITPTTLETLFEYDCTQSKLGKGIELGKVIKAFGMFLLEHTQYEIPQINRKLEADPHMQQDSLVNLIEKYNGSIPWMLQVGFLSHNFLHAKAMQVISARIIDFQVITENKWILDLKVCNPAEVADLLAITRDTQDFTKFVDKYWDWPINKYHRELFPQNALEYDKMATLHSEYRAKQELSVRKIGEITRAYKEEKQGIRRDLERRQNQIKDRYFSKKSKIPYSASDRASQISDIEIKKARKLQDLTDEYMPRLRQAKAKRSQDIEKVKTDFQEECIKINKEWSTWHMQQRYNVSSPTLQQPQPVYVAPLPTIIINNNGSAGYQPPQAQYTYTPNNNPPPYNPNSFPASAPPL